MSDNVKIEHYSDVLCVWAYIAQVHTTELVEQFPAQLDWHWHYLPVFGDTPNKFATQWADRGGVEGYAQHMHEVAAAFDHIEVHDDCWTKVRPASSALHDGSAYAALCHDMLKARDANIRISPTYVFNDDRQRLTGNVGYRIIEANVRELLEQPQKQQSWC